MTKVIELTPRGRGALAVVLVAGPEAVQIVDDCFHAASGRPLAEEPADRIVLGRWGGAEGEELIVCRRADDRVEVHCHGGLAAVGAVIEQLTRRGCRRVLWQEWLQRTADDPIRAAGQTALADAPTQRTAAILLDQYDGALAAAIRGALDAVTADLWQQAAAVLDELLAFCDLGLHLTQPWQVVLAGPPNVGKSSLINALVGHQRAIVCDLAGTTRDVVRATTAIDGWPIYLADTAGLRESTDEIETAALAQAGAALAAADLVLLVSDATETGGPTRESDVEQRVPATARRLRVRNKIDLLATPPAAAADELFTSAVTGQGIDELVAAIGRALVPAAPERGTAVPFAVDHVAALDDARAAIDGRDAPAARAALQSLLAW